MLAERAGSSAETIATYYLAKPTLQRDLGVPDDLESFDAWVTKIRTDLERGTHAATSS